MLKSLFFDSFTFFSLPPFLLLLRVLREFPVSGIRERRDRRLHRYTKLV